MTRADWYAQNTRGGWRKARRGFTCGQSLCLNRVQAGEKYFDTCKPISTKFSTLRICAACAETILKD